MFSNLWIYLTSNQKKQYILILVLMVIVAVTEVVSIGLVIPFLGMLANPEIVFNHSFLNPIFQSLGFINYDQIILPVSLLFIFSVLIVGMIRMYLLYRMNKLSYETGANLGLDIYKRTLYQEYSVHINRNSSEMISGIISKTDMVVNGVIAPMLLFLSSFFILFGIMIVLFVIDPKIMIGMLTSFGLFYFIISFYTKKLVRENGEKISKNSNIVVKSLQEGLGGIRDIILDGSQELYCKSYYAADYSLRKAVGDNQVIAVIPRYAVEAFGIILIVTFTYFEMVNGVGISSIIPVLGAFALGAQRAMPTLQQMYASQIAIRGSKEIFMDVLSLLQQPMPTVNNENKSIQIPFENNLELRNVSFQYSKDSPWILHNINLNIKKGEMIGFVGETGSGKSTLLDIIMGLITQTNGEILVDGTPINSLNIKGWRHHVSHVPQNIFLLDGSLEENISFNSVEDDIDFIRIESASEAANLSKVVERLKEGYKTIVGERGSKLSGGQCQRVGIARALYKQSELMILDEATSALDGITEKDIMKKIDDLNDNLTILIVAHRVTTLKKCDRIFKVKGGDLFSIEYSELLEHT